MNWVSGSGCNDVEKPKTILDWMDELDEKYGKGNWAKLPDNHPDIETMHELSGAKVKETMWTDKRNEFIRENYQHMTDGEMAEILGVKVTTLGNHRIRMGLRKQSHSSKPLTVIQMDLEYNELARYKSADVASKMTGISRASIQRSASGMLKAAKGFVWKYEGAGK